MQTVGCRGDDRCTTLAMTAQRPCWVNMDSPESGTTGNDTTEEKTQMHTNTPNMNDRTLLTHRGLRCFS